MSFDELEARLHLLPGQISELEPRKGYLYAKVDVQPKKRLWDTYSKRKVRSVWSPCPELKVIHHQIHRLISSHFLPHPIAHAYTRGRGIVSNAQQHVAKAWLLHIDLVNFFGSIREKVVREALGRLLRHFNDYEIGVIAHLCCHEGFLPQGSPTSPILSNLVCFHLDQQLEALAGSLSLTVTRYSDDICFSSANAVLPAELATVLGHGAKRQIELGAPLCSLFDLYGFEINRKKLRFQDRTERQQVNGLVVNDRVNVPNDYYRQVRRILHLWDRYGIDVAAFRYGPSSSAQGFSSSLKGLIDYIGQVTGRGDERYQAFMLTFKELTAREVV